MEGSIAWKKMEFEKHSSSPKVSKFSMILPYPPSLNDPHLVFWNPKISCKGMA